MKHHYVPECYLKQFVDSNGMLALLNLKLFKERSKFLEQKKAPAAVCYIPGYYAIDEQVSPNSFFGELNQYDSEHIETRVFLDFEDNFRKQYDKLTGPEKTLDKKFWTKGIISLKKRNPYYLEKQDFDFLKIEATNNLREHLHSITDDEDAFKALDDIAGRIGTELNAQRKFNLTSLIHDAQGMDTSSEAEETIQSLQWDVLTADSDYPFTTTDNPGFAIASDGEFNSFKFLDNYRQVTFFMPISPTHCLRIQSQPNKIYIGKVVREIKLSKYEVFTINLGGIKFAKNLCISNTSGSFYQMQNEIVSLFSFRKQLEMFSFPNFLKKF